MKKLVMDGIERMPTENEKIRVKNFFTERYNKILEKTSLLFLTFIFFLGFNTYSFITNIFPIWLNFILYILLVLGIIPVIKLVKNETDFYEEVIDIIDNDY